MNDNILDPFHFVIWAKIVVSAKYNVKNISFLLLWTGQEYYKHVFIVVLTLHRYSSIFSESVQMFSQLSILSHLNKQLYYCASSQHALHLEKIMLQLIQNYNFFTFWWLDLCCSCCCHCCLAAIWFRVHIFGELTFVDLLCVWDLCVEEHVHFITTAGCNIFG